MQLESHCTCSDNQNCYELRLHITSGAFLSQCDEPTRPVNNYVLLMDSAKFTPRSLRHRQSLNTKSKTQESFVFKDELNILHIAKYHTYSSNPHLRYNFQHFQQLEIFKCTTAAVYFVVVL